MVAILFVCMGNICRSPSAEGVFTALVTQQGLDGHIRIDSAGTHAYHVGEPPDARSVAAARDRGIDISLLRARQFSQSDFDAFDYILVADRTNELLLKQAADPAVHDKIQLFLTYGSLGKNEIPDPYYGGEQGFEHVLDLIEDASVGLLAHVKQHHLQATQV